MTIAVTHPFVSAKTDGADGTLVQPSDWNDGHTITLAAGKVMGRDTSAAGAVQELPLAFATTYDVTLPLTTGSMIGAKGTTVQRSVTPVAGMVRYNTSLVQWEGYDTDWRKLMTDAAVTAVITAATDTIPAYVSGVIYGLTLSTAGSSATFGIAAGNAVNSTNVKFMTLASAYTKTTSAWALGTAAGALDTGSIANSTWYHVFLIKRVDTDVVDVLLSLSATAPTLPANYTLFRRIGSMQTNGSAQWVKFNQQGDRFDRLPVTDFTAAGTSAATLRTLSVPTGAIVLPILSINVQAVGNTASIVQLAPANDATLLVIAANMYEGDAFAGSTNTSYCQGPPTNTSAQLYVAVPNYSATTYIETSGWIDRRGRDG